MKDKSPVFVASIDRAKGGKIGTTTSTPPFSVRMRNTPSRTCWRPRLDHVASPQPGEEQKVERKPLAGPDWPVRLEALYLVFGPNLEAARLRPLNVLDILGRIGCDQFGILRPCEQ